MCKIMEELGELAKAINKGDKEKTFNSENPKVKDLVRLKRICKGL